MTKVQINFEGRKAVADLSRIPVAGDFIAKRGGPVEVTQVVLLAPDMPVDAVVTCVSAKNKLSTDIQDAISEFLETESAS